MHTISLLVETSVLLFRKKNKMPVAASKMHKIRRMKQYVNISKNKKNISYCEHIENKKNVRYKKNEKHERKEKNEKHANNKKNEKQIREYLDGNLCRCTGYHNIVKSIKNYLEEINLLDEKI